MTKGSLITYSGVIGTEIDIPKEMSRKILDAVGHLKNPLGGTRRLIEMPIVCDFPCVRAIRVMWENGTISAIQTVGKVIVVWHKDKSPQYFLDTGYIRHLLDVALRPAFEDLAAGGQGLGAGNL